MVSSNARRGVRRFLPLLLLLLSASLLPLTTSATARLASWKVADVLNADFVSDRVAILTTTEREDPSSEWCIGLLVAPHALLTHAHCVANKSITWAYFGSSHESVLAAQKPVSVPVYAASEPGAPPAAFAKGSATVMNATSPTNASADASSSSTSPSSSSSRLRGSPSAVQVGDVVDWVQIASVVLHPEYDPASTATIDLAIVRLVAAREIEPFQLLPDADADANGTDVFTTNDFAGYRVSNTLLASTNTNAVEKVRSIGSFYRTPWVFCTNQRVNGKTLPTTRVRNDRMCILPSAVDRRVELSAVNSFVMVGDQLAGLSMCYSSDCAQSVVHPFMLVAGAREFIKSATQTQEKWTDVSLLMIGGVETPVQGYLAGLRKTKTSPNFCLGTLIAPQVVLTAAHCVRDVSFSFVSVGSRYSSTDADGEQIRVRSVKVHSSFDPQTYAFDFALVELTYMSVQLPLVLDNESDRDLYTTSALTLYGYNEAQQSQFLSLPLVSAATCKAMIADASVDTSGMVCAGGEEGKDGCQGDSGAPLVQDATDDGGQYLVALSSFGWSCGLKDVPAVYAKVTAAMSFIQQNVVGHSWRYPIAKDGLVPPSSETTGDDAVVGGDADAGDVVVGDDNANEQQQSPGSSHPLWPPEKDRSNGGAGGPVTGETDNDIISKICLKEGWTLTQQIAVGDDVQSIVIPTSTSQFTRNTVATTLLASSGAEVFRLADNGDATAAASKYSCAGSIEMYSSADLTSIRRTLAKFENRELRTRESRFARPPGTTRLPVS